MGTRSLTVVKDENNKDIIVLYRQFDGYPSGHGQELADFLAPLVVVDGISDRTMKAANGVGCLAAQVVAHFKTEIGNFYLYPSGTRDCGEEYIYTVTVKNKKLHLTVQGGIVTFFGLPGTKQARMPIIWKGDIKDYNAKEAEANYDKAMNPKEEGAS